VDIERRFKVNEDKLSSAFYFGRVYIICLKVEGLERREGK
jgi:hypothetical protein